MRFSLVFLMAIIIACQSKNSKSKIVVLISANAEWRVVKALYPNENYQTTPWGEYFVLDMTTAKGNTPVIFFHEGWGKVAAAGATQYAIDRWNPEVFINLGTCGGFEGSVNRF